LRKQNICRYESYINFMISRINTILYINHTRKAIFLTFIIIIFFLYKYIKNTEDRFRNINTIKTQMFILKFLRKLPYGASKKRRDMLDSFFINILNISL